MSPHLKTWHPLAFFVCNIAAILLYSSWLYEPTRALWDGLDNGLFYILNGSLQIGETWQTIWALANHRTVDVVVGIVMIIFFWHFILTGGRRLIMERMVLFGLMAAMMLATQEGLIDLYQQIIDVTRKSPSLVLEPVYRLSELVPDIKAKDASGSSFPGDHGTVVFIWLGFIFTFASRKHGIAAVLLCILILLPRLVSGAHWITDNLVGSGTLVLLMMAWIVFSPAGYLLRLVGEKILSFILPKSWQRVPKF
ncbi:MAG: phosphatase PAP2 family protein [Candidatus Sedimenticola sp. PURPLELP]